MSKRIFTTTALVLKKTAIGEADRNFLLFTKEMGKIMARAVGVRKLKSRKGGNLELFNLVNAQLRLKNDFFILSRWP